MNPYFIRCLTACGLLLLNVNSVAAAYWKDIYPSLTEEDMEILQRTARQGMDEKPEGTSLSWTNVKTGTSGTVTLVKRFSVEGRECRKLRHEFVVPGEQPWRFDSALCRQPDGSWQWLEPER